MQTKRLKCKCSSMALPVALLQQAFYTSSWQGAQLPVENVFLMAELLLVAKS